MPIVINNCSVCGCEPNVFTRQTFKAADNFYNSCVIEFEIGCNGSYQRSKCRVDGVEVVTALDFPAALKKWNDAHPLKELSNPVAEEVRIQRNGKGRLERTVSGPTSQLLSVFQVSELTQLRPQRIYDLTRKGQLPFAVKFGRGQYRYNLDGLKEWIAKGGELCR